MPTLALWLGPEDDEIARRAARSVTLPDALEVHRVSIRVLPTWLRPPSFPSGILSPLIWDDGDAFEVARLLHAAHFAGFYRIVAPNLPQPALVLSEIRQANPLVDIDFL